MSARKPAFIVLDWETTGLRWYADVGHGFAVGLDDESEPVYYRHGEVPDYVRAWIADPSIPKVGHNLRFDWKFFVSMGYDIQGDWFCTRVLAHVLDETRPGFGLKELTAAHLPPGSLQDKGLLDELCLELVAQEYTKKGKEKERKPIHIGELCEADLALPDHPYTPIIARYCIEDVRNTRALFRLFGRQLREMDIRAKELFGVTRGPLDYYLQESMPAERALAALEQDGIALDESQVRAYGEVLRAEEVETEGRLNTLAAPWTAPVEQRLLQKHLDTLTTDKGKAKLLREPHRHPRFNWASPQQVASVLYEGMKLPAGLKRSTDEGTVSLLAARKHSDERIPKVLEALLELRAVQKLRGTYIDGMLERVYKGRIYAEYPPYTDTGRLSSTNPNMQNIPRKSPLKRAFVPDTPDDCFVYFDYSQVELRIAADNSQDPVMLDWFNLGIDPHKQAAVDSFGVAFESVTDAHRQPAKRMNFLTIFDGKAGRLEQTLREDGVKKPDGKPFTKDECKALLDGWWRGHPVYRAYLDGVLQQALRFGAVIAKNGRVRRLPDIRYGQWIDYRRRRFTGPDSLRRQIEADIAAGRCGDAVLEAPAHERVFVYCAMKFSHAKKQAYNIGIQSIGATITKAAIVALTARGYKVRTTVHDSCVVQVPRTEAAAAAGLIKAVAEGCHKLTVPLTCDVKILNSLSEADVYVPIGSVEKSTVA